MFWYSTRVTLTTSGIALPVLKHKEHCCWGVQIYPKYLIEHNIIVAGHLVQSIGITLFRYKMGL